MQLQTIPRGAVDVTVRLARLPWDAGVRLVAFSDAAQASQLRLRIDRLDAQARGLAGRALRDPDLRKDATRRRLAAEKREKAVTLEAEADDRRQEAEEVRRAGRREAEQQRTDAEKRASSAKAKVEKEEKGKKRKASERAGRGKAVARRKKQATDKAIDGQARDDRLEQLDHEAAALNERDEALATRDEARRLRKAAASTKANRKRSS